jgi:hypothetical protein
MIRTCNICNKQFNGIDFVYICIDCYFIHEYMVLFKDLYEVQLKNNTSLSAREWLTDRLLKAYPDETLDSIQKKIIIVEL